MTDQHRFKTCPDCEGDLEYQTRSSVLCRDCGSDFTHIDTGSEHGLRRITAEHDVGEVVARV